MKCVRNWSQILSEKHCLDRPSPFKRCLEGSEALESKHRSTTACSTLLWAKVNTSGIRRCSRALRVNMKPSSELPPRASRCAQSVQVEVVCFQLSPQRLHLFALVDLGHAAREDVNDSLFGKRRAANCIIETMGSSRCSSRSVGHIQIQMPFKSSCD